MLVKKIADVGANKKTAEPWERLGDFRQRCFFATRRLHCVRAFAAFDLAAARQSSSAALKGYSRRRSCASTARFIFDASALRMRWA